MNLEVKVAELKNQIRREVNSIETHQQKINQKQNQILQTQQLINQRQQQIGVKSEGVNEIIENLEQQLEEAENFLEQKTIERISVQREVDASGRRKLTPPERTSSALLGKLNLVSQLVERGSPDSDVWNLRCLRRRGCQPVLVL